MTLLAHHHHYHYLSLFRMIFQCEGKQFDKRVAKYVLYMLQTKQSRVVFRNHRYLLRLLTLIDSRDREYSDCMDFRIRHSNRVDNAQMALAKYKSMLRSNRYMESCNRKDEGIRSMINPR